MATDLIVDRRSAAIESAALTPHMTPMQELQMQIVRTGDLEKLRELRAIEKEWREDQAKQAFNKAFAGFKSEAVRLLRTKLITDGPLKGKKHVDLGEVLRVTTPALAKYGLSIAWDLTRDEKDWMEVKCILRHDDGHSESVSMGGAPDAGPARNAIQARMSAQTYLRRYTATAILGLAPEEDDDGRAAGAPIQQAPSHEPLESGVMADLLSSIEGAGDLDELKTVYQRALKLADDAHDSAATRELAEAKNKRYRQIAQKAGRQ